MSWGFFVDLNLQLPRDAWARLQTRTPGETTLADGWSGLADAALERRFGAPSHRTTPYGELLPRFDDAESIVRIDASGDRVAIRVCVLADRSLLDHAYPLATLLYAAAAERGEGRLRLVNDGTYAGETGSAIALVNGAITAAPLDDDAAVEELGAELLERIGHTLPAGPRRSGGIDPFTGKRVGDDG